jgi:tetratricopeptide (TPR) repeat protein
VDLAIPENIKMRKQGIYSIVILLLAIAGCGKQAIPSKVSADKDVQYDVAKFDYIYVEAIKQKILGNFGDALQYLEQCVKINPKSDAAFYQMSQVVASGGDIHNAKKYMSKAISLEGSNSWYLVSLSGMYYQEKNIDSAIIYYEKAVKLTPDNENIQLTLGNLYIENKEFEKANGIFDAFDKKYGVNEESTISSIQSLMAEGKFNDAQAKAEELLKQKPDEILYNGLLAEILRAKGDKEKAMEVYGKLIERNPDNPQIQLSLADFLLSEKMYDDLFALLNNITLNSSIRKEDKTSLFARMIDTPELVKDSEKRISIALMVLEATYKDDPVVPLLQADLYLKSGKQQDAAQRLQDMIKKNPENYYAWEKLLLVYLDMKDYTMLEKAGEECANKFNMSLLAKILFANGAMENGHYDVALAELKKAGILAGEDKEQKVQVLTMKADVYYRMKDFVNAFATFEEALKYGSNDVTLLNNYAYYLAEQNTKLKEAEELSRKVVEQEKGNTTFLDTYGWVLYKRGKINEAAKIFEGILKSGEKDDAEWFEHYGYILKKQKKCPKAVEYWKKALELDSTKTNLTKEIQSCGK